MSKVVRASKYRHVFGTEWKKEKWLDNVKITSSAFDSNFIKVNPAYIAIAWQSAGGGSFAAISTKSEGKLAADLPLVAGHTAAVQDIDFNPFNDYIVASSSEDTTVKIWQLPEGGLKESMRESVQTLSGHQKKAGIISFHPLAANVLATTGADGMVKIWDIETAQTKAEIADPAVQEIISSFTWNFEGSLCATTCKDKLCRLIDPRSQSIVSSVEAHYGAKGSRVLWLGRKDRLLTVGFSRSSERQFSIWDPRNLTEALSTFNIDNAAGMIMPFYDDDTAVCYLAGKGDGSIRYIEAIDEHPYYYDLSAFKSNAPQKGVAFMPKRGLDVKKCEVARCYKLTGTNVVQIELCVPRKGDQFQADIFPDTLSSEPVMTASEWFGGANTPPKFVSMAPGTQHATSAATTSFKAAGSNRVAELEEENAALKAKIAELEAKIASM
eukprot:TRINITY_DN3620_c0_g1_i1.p1 TRINITY_DN3620_c0_g1~~TRINITY_DN3620_c0_g1_i1.p1  ORF type:complete len:457 (-),score=103.86 TRINITY_DN3620_c0_g1_i1:63-1379(-)